MLMLTVTVLGTPPAAGTPRRAADWPRPLQPEERNQLKNKMMNYRKIILFLLSGKAKERLTDRNRRFKFDLNNRQSINQVWSTRERFVESTSMIP